VKLDQLVWQDKEVGKFINSRFIPLRFTPSDEDYRQIRTEYKVRGTPTAVFLNHLGEEIDRKIGFNGNRDEYFQIIQNLALGKDSLLSLTAQLKENPDDVEANFKIGKRYIDRYEWENVQPYFAKVLEIDPEDEMGFGSEATYNLAVYDLRINGKIKPLKQFIATSTDQERLYQAYTDLASHFIRTDKLDEASKLYEEALEKWPSNADLMADYAMFVFTSKIKDRYEKGFERAKKALSLKPEDEDVVFSSYYGILSYYKNADKLDKYFETFEEVLRKLPKNTFFKYSYAEAILTFQISDKIDSGIEVMLDALETEPEAPHLWHSLSKLYFEKGDMSKSIEAAQKAVEIVPNNEQYQQTLEKFKKAKEEIK
jgi:tetratricopeptide (TPR) repeat protein